MRPLLLLLACACIHEPRVLRLRTDATPWKLDQPFEARVASGELLALRFDLEAPGGIAFKCAATPAAAGMSVYGRGEEALARGPCRTIELRGLDRGAYFLLVHSEEGPAEFTLEAALLPPGN